MRKKKELYTNTNQIPSLKLHVDNKEHMFFLKTVTKQKILINILLNISTIFNKNVVIFIKVCVRACAVKFYAFLVCVSVKAPNPSALGIHFCKLIRSCRQFLFPSAQLISVVLCKTRTKQINTHTYLHRRNTDIEEMIIASKTPKVFRNQAIYIQNSIGKQERVQDIKKNVN